MQYGVVLAGMALAIVACGGAGGGSCAHQPGQAQPAASSIGSQPSSASSQAVVVGGPCSYEAFAGQCESDASGATFTFRGTVDGKTAELAGNEASPGAFTAAQTKDCQLSFIRTGTCTPCIFSVGSCGKAAFDLFGARRQ